MNEEDDHVPPKTPLDYISRDQLQDMWGAGFTVIRRNTFGNDIYELADRVKRPGMARQWMDRDEIQQFIVNGWKTVFCEDYPGLFAPYGFEGAVEVGDLRLFECPQHRVDKARQDQVAAAEKLVTDWQDKYGGQFSGSVTIAGQTELGKLDTVKTIKIGTTKTIEDTTAIPKDMVPYMAQIFEERDRLADDYTKGSGMETDWAHAAYHTHMIEHPEAAAWPTLNAILLPQAINNVRKRITEEPTDGETSGN